MKKRHVNVWTKSLAFFLAVLTAFYCVPVVAISDDELSGEQIGTATDKAGQKMDTEGAAFEVIDRREETVKHFRLSDGTYAAVQYDMPVHSLDADGTWQDIDNTLSEVGKEYSTTNARVKFAKKVTGNETLFTLHDGNSKITMSLVGAKKKTNGIVTNDYSASGNGATELQKLMAESTQKLTSRIIYEDILENVDLEYVVESNDVKENIIVKERLEQYSFTFSIALNNLTAELCENGSVRIFDPETQDTVFMIPKGYMEDANGDSSIDVFYTLNNHGNGTYELTVTADPEWMNSPDRAFPVTIDPTVIIRNDETGMFYSSGYSFRSIKRSTNEDEFNGSANMWIGYDVTVYWKINNNMLPVLPDNAIITGASWNVWNWKSLSVGSDRLDTAFYVTLHNIVSPWDNSTPPRTFNSGEAGKIDDTIIQEVSLGDYKDNYTVDITSFVIQWKNNPEENYGFALRPKFYYTDFLRLAGNHGMIEANHRPIIILMYKEMTGTEPDWDTLEQNLGIAGNGFVNLNRGYLTYELPTLTTTEKLFSYTPTLVYNSYNSDRYAPEGVYQCGQGFKLNTEETITPLLAVSDDQNYGNTQEEGLIQYSWEDGDGTLHTIDCIRSGEMRCYSTNQTLYLIDKIGYINVYNTGFNKLVWTFTLISSEHEEEDGLFTCDYRVNACTQNGTPVEYEPEQILRRYSQRINGTEEIWYQWLNSDGDIYKEFRTFYIEEEITYFDVDVPSNKIWLTNNEDGSSCFHIKDKDRVKKVFIRPEGEDIFYLDRIIDENNNELIFNYSYQNQIRCLDSISLKPNGSSYSAFEILSFAYNSYGYLAEISHPVSEDRYEFLYGDDYSDPDVENYGFLKQVKVYFSGANTPAYSILYDYDEDVLSAVTDEVGLYKLQYLYTDEKVTTITEYSGTGYTAKGLEQRITYDDNLTVVRNPGKNGLINEGASGDDILTYFVFDNRGIAVNSYSTNAAGTKLYGASANNQGSLQIDGVTVQSRTEVGGLYANICINGGFEQMTQSTITGWSSSSTVARSIRASFLGNVTVGNDYCAKLWSNNSTESKISQELYLDQPGSYMISYDLYAYQSYVSGSTEGKIRILDKDSGSVLLEENLPLSQLNTVNGFVRSNQTFTTTEEFAWVIIEFTFINSNSTTKMIYLDDIMVNVGDAVAPYDMVSFGSFADSSDDTMWTDFWDFGEADSAFQVAYKDDLFNRSLKCTLNGSTNYSVSQTIYSMPDEVLSQYEQGNYAPREQHLTFSGWMKSSTSYSSDLYNRSMVLTVAYEDAYMQFCTLEPVRSNTSWQYMSGTIDTTPSHGYITEIWVDIYCDGYTGIYYFDNISVVVDYASAASYEYDADGSIKSSIVGGKRTYFQYDAQNRVTRSVSDKAGINYLYDQYGRELSETAFTYDGTYDYTSDSFTGNVTYMYAIEYGYNQFGQVTQRTFYGIADDYSESAAEQGYGLGSLRYNSQADTSSNPIGTQLSTERYSFDTTPESPVFGAILTAYSSITRLTERYQYGAYDCLLRLKYHGDGKVSLFEYDDNKRLQRIDEGMESVSADGNTTVTWYASGDTLEFSYTDWDGISSIRTDTTTYSFAYNTWHQNTRITAGSLTLCNMHYQSGNGHVTTMSYGNGYQVYFYYDNLDRLASVCYYNCGMISVCSYEYDALGRISRYIDNLNNIHIDYTYDFAGNITEYTTYVGDTACVHSTLVYDTDGKLTSTKSSFTAGGTAFTEQSAYTYDALDFPDGYTLTLHSGSGTVTTYSENYSYDSMGHLNAQTNVLSRGSSTLTANTAYTYIASTNRVKTFTTTVAGGTSTEERYTYDSTGNLTIVKDGNGNTKYRYRYDTIGQLIRVDDAVRGVTVVYTYDASGNRLTATTYSYTLASVIRSDPLNTQSYGYGNNNWGDLLVSYSSGSGTAHSMTYDGSGNPIIYYNSDTPMTMTWERGNLLSQITSGSNTYRYSYSSDGVRLSKTVNGVVHTYTVSESVILAEEWVDGTDAYTLTYLYGSDGLPVGMRAEQKNTSMYWISSTAYYWFEKNLQGDIIAVYKNNGTKIATYAYDAWGVCYENITASSSSMDYQIASSNPFRYRGYYYDVETGFYYLQTRYYDPVHGRFLNADSPAYLGSNGDLVAYNLFLYCSNNPIMGTDYSGEAADFETFCNGFGKVITGVSCAVTAVGCIVAVVTAAVAGAEICIPALIGAVGTFVLSSATVAVGLVEINESITGYNVIRDDMMHGRQDVYDLAVTLLQWSMTAAAIYTTAGIATGNLCFAAGTPVQTESGSVPIEEIAVGDYVWATDPETGVTELKQVTQLFRNETNEWIHVTVNGEEITCTPNHPFYSPVKGWTSACKLRAGDVLVTLNGEYVVVEQVQHELLENPETTYNFEVEDFHTYYVGEEPMLVHNMCKGTSDDFLPLSNNKEATQVAQKMGYSPTKNVSNGQKVFVNKSAPKSLRYITRDVDSHNGGVWKAAKTIKDLGSRVTRSGTYSRWLNIRIGG